MTANEAALEMAKELEAALNKLAETMPALQKKITSMSENSSDSLGTLRKRVTSLRAGFLNLAVGIAGAAGAAGLFLGRMDNQAKTLRDLAKQTSMSTDEIQQWQYAAKATGGDSSAVIKDLDKLRASFMKSGKSAGEAAQAAQDRFMELAGKMKGMDWKDASALGKSFDLSEDTIRLLQRGVDGVRELHKEAGNMGMVITPEALQSFRTMNRDADILADSLRNLGGDALVGVSEVFKELVGWFKSWNAENRKWLSAKVQDTAKSMAEGFKSFLEIAKQVKAKALDPLLTALDPFLQKLAKNKDLISDMVTGALAGLMVILAPIAAKMVLVAGAFSLLGGLVRNVFELFAGGNSTLGKFHNWLASCAGSIRDFCAENDSLIRSLAVAVGSFSTFKLAMSIGGIIQSAGGAMSVLGGTLASVSQLFPALVGGLNGAGRSERSKRCPQP